MASVPPLDVVPAGTGDVGAEFGDEPIILARNISKSYGGVKALRDVTFRAYRGKVNVLVGENGAGKSTLMKILSGSAEPTSGEILLAGEPVTLPSPRAAQELGIGIIHQELSLFPNMSIAENMFAGREPRKGRRFVDFGHEKRRAAEVLARLGQSHLDPRRLVSELPIGQQQLVEIGRVLLEDVRILIMDEPTSALSNHEVDVLFEVMEELRKQDVTIIYISHKLDEFRRIGDYVTVFRDGALVSTESMTRTDTGWIVRQMVGRDPNSLFSRSGVTPGETLLEVRGLTSPGPVRPLVDDVTFSVAAGEVVGIYGLMGAGRTELMECLMGTREVSAGEVLIKGEPETTGTVQSRLDAGLALVPEDRQRDGLVQPMSVRDNVVLAVLSKLKRAGVLSQGEVQRTAEAKVKDLTIKIPGLGAQVTSLSGGNQQKVVLARALLTEPVVLLLDEPTRGIDIGAKSQIAGIMADLARSGFGVLFISSELAEVIAMADRVLVMAKGRITARFTAENVTEEKLVAASASDRVLEEIR
ncbi:ATP-binding cassette domain-containing protein [Nakamurella sp. YIM 132087]|uniref:ATP-binding cassette domain-containing protein n=1 Tax=Nakamurella alba TaxID=2665158 RepID=A0A7K1FGQ1_9ACTN|nr:sugar ABC transporter ATP-binding protein [Nakamurella alba]MTD13240.1 ATP-binding cassette domain-containing protein [Nakamurella alba]